MTPYIRLHCTHKRDRHCALCISIGVLHFTCVPDVIVRRICSIRRGYWSFWSGYWPGARRFVRNALCIVCYSITERKVSRVLLNKKSYVRACAHAMIVALVSFEIPPSISPYCNPAYNFTSLSQERSQSVVEVCSQQKQ